MRQVLQILRKEKLCLKPEKCSFGTPTIDYLGYIIGSGEVRMDPKKVKTITEWTTPKNLTQLQSFLGFCNFYRRFIQGYSAITKPLHRLTGKVDWEWTKDQQVAFDTLKQAISTEPVLAVPINDAPFRIEANSSDFANGAVLSQFIDGKWKPIAYRSQSLSDTERNYEVYDKELLAIMRSLEDWRQYLLGARHTFEIITDHSNLTYYREPQKLTRRQARWFLELQEYDFKLIHHSGTLNAKADILSR